MGGLQNAYFYCKGKSLEVKSNASTSDFTLGLGILLAAQMLSAYMGAYVEDTYAAYRASWTENLFYSHFLSLPLFLPVAPILRRQYAKLAATPHIEAARYLPLAKDSTQPLPDWAMQRLGNALETLPHGLFFLFVNAITQLACISGVNLLSAKSSAVTVTIVLNIRKLVSFMFSTWLFGHQLSGKMLVGAAMVFGSGALYGWESSWRLPRQRAREAKANGHAKKT